MRHHEVLIKRTTSKAAPIKRYLGMYTIQSIALSAVKVVILRGNMRIQARLKVVAFAIAIFGTRAQAVLKTSPPITLMVVGSSLSQGWEGDFTWRYRLWEWFRDQSVDATFVGPYNGTYPQSDGVGPMCKRRQVRNDATSPSSYTDLVAGANYAEGTEENWPRSHYALRNTLAARVKLKKIAVQFHPDYILIELGIADLVAKRHPEEILADLKRLVDEARAAKADVRVAISTIPNMQQLAGFPYLLPGWTDDLNEALEVQVRQWSTLKSQVVLVRLRETYNCTPNDCPVAWDGIHPAELGEYQIASAFSQALHKDFRIGSVSLHVPAETDIPQAPVLMPSNLKAKSVPWGIKLTWDKVVGAHRYEVNRRRTNTTEWQTSWSGNGHEYGANRYDALDVADGEDWDFRVRVNKGEVSGVLRVSEWSPIESTIAHPTTDICGRKLKHSHLLAIHLASSYKSLTILSVGFLIISAIVYEGTRKFLTQRITRHNIFKAFVELYREGASF